MRDRLSTVHEDNSTHGMSQFDNLRCRVDRAQDVGHVCKRDQFRGPVKKRFIGFQVQQTFFCHGDEIQLNTALRLKHVPRHKIAVMFHLGQNNKVTCLQVSASPGISNQVDRFGCIPGVNDLARRRCIDELRNPFTRAFIHRCSFFSQRMHATMDIGIRAAIIIVHCLDHLHRLL